MSGQTYLASKIVNLLTAWGLESSANWLGPILLIAAVLLVAAVIHLIARRVIIRLLNSLVGRTQARWDDALAEMKVFDRLAHLLPALVLYFGAGLNCDRRSTVSSSKMSPISGTGRKRPAMVRNRRTLHGIFSLLAPDTKS